MAERKLGEIWKGNPKRGPQHSKGGGSKGSKRELLPNAPPTLSDIGISKMQSSRWQAEVIGKHPFWRQNQPYLSMVFRGAGFWGRLTYFSSEVAFASLDVHLSRG
jgi:hypothetical protein